MEKSQVEFLNGDRMWTRQSLFHQSYGFFFPHNPVMFVAYPISSYPDYFRFYCAFFIFLFQSYYVQFSLLFTLLFCQFRHNALDASLISYFSHFLLHKQCSISNLAHPQLYLDIEKFAHLKMVDNFIPKFIDSSIELFIAIELIECQDRSKDHPQSVELFEN